MRRLTASVCLVAAALTVTACSSESEGPGFSTRIDNPWWPMKPGSRWVSIEHEGGHTYRVVVTVTGRTKVVASGVRARVVHDIVTEKGRVVENTYDWYAQDRTGNVWYLGEDTKAYEPGKPVSTEGSWEAGIDGAKAGIALPAHPRVGMDYRQEYYRGHAEDRGRVLRLDASATVPLGSFKNLLETRDYTRLEPDATEHKFYARGIGPVLTTAVQGGGREELVSYRRGGA